MTTKRPKLVMMLQGQVYRETFVLIRADRRFLDRQQRAVCRGLFWRVFGGANVQVKDSRSREHL